MTAQETWRALTRGRGALITAAILCTLIFLATATLVLTLPDQEQPPQGLPQLARANDIELGVAVAVNPLVNDPQYRSVVTENYTSVTAENAMKWINVQPERHTFDWSGPDAIVGFAERNGLDIHGHTLLWHNQQPTWLAQGSWTPDELRQVMREHMQALLGRYEGRITSWDIINEPFEDTGPRLRQNLWYQVLGEDYIAQALTMAHQIDPEAKLYINEFGIEGGGPKTDALYRLVTNLLDQGVPLHGIGFQGHFIQGHVPDNMAEQMRRFTDLGLEVSLGELDIRIPEPVDETDLQQQAHAYEQAISACLEVPRCVRVSVWGVSDQHSWIPEWFPGYTAALPFDDSYAPKPALDGMTTALSRTTADRRRPRPAQGPRTRTAPR